MAEYPGLPNFGYGVQIPIDTLLQLLPFKTLPKQLAQQDLARLQAQTGLATEQTLGAQQERGLRPAESAALVGERNAATAGALGREQREQKLLPLQQQMLQAQREGMNAQTALHRQDRWMNPIKTAADIGFRGAAAMQDNTRTKIAQQEVDQTGQWQKGALENNKLAQLVNALQIASTAFRKVPLLDSKGRVIPDPKTGKPVNELQSVVTPDMWESLIQQLAGGQVPMGGGSTGPQPDANALRVLTEGMREPPALNTVDQKAIEFLSKVLTLDPTRGTAPVSMLEQMGNALPATQVQTTLGPQLDALFKKYPPEQILQLLKESVDAYYKGQNDELQKRLP